MRKETKGTLPIQDYLRAKISGDNSLMAADLMAFNASSANSQRPIRRRPGA